MTLIVRTGITTNVGTAVSVVAGDTLYVATAAEVIGGTDGVAMGGSAITNNGSIYGLNRAISVTSIGTYIRNSAQGLIQSDGTAITFSSFINLNNDGAIYGHNFAITGGNAATSLSVVNNGSIEAAAGAAIDIGLGAATAYSIFNRGIITGNVFAGRSGGTFDSTYGAFHGTFYGNSGEDYAVGGTTNCYLFGGGADDILIANRTQSAADNRAVTTLDGDDGHNALYGGGGINVFNLGTGGPNTTNQVWGEASQMNDVAGFLNNTVSYDQSISGVYVDLLNGHNAYLGSTLFAAWGGTGVFSDWIVNVPNVIGSIYGDVIQGNGTGGKIFGSGGADALYGATGVDIFEYSQYSDSNTVTGYDTIVGFQRGTDKIDISDFMGDFGLPGASLVIFGSGNSSTVYVERTPGTFNSATDLAFIVNSTAGVLTAADFIL